MFTENGYEKKTLEKITKNHLNELQSPSINNKDTSEDINKVVKLPWIPIIGPKLRHTFFFKKSIKTISTSDPNLKSLLCRNKTKWEKRDNSGATEHTLTCHGQFNWIHSNAIARENDYRKRKIREALETKEKL